MRYQWRELSSQDEEWSGVCHERADLLDDPDEKASWIDTTAALFVCVVALVTVFLLGWMCGEGSAHREAIKRGLAERTPGGFEWRE